MSTCMGTLQLTVSLEAGLVHVDVVDLQVFIKKKNFLKNSPVVHFEYTISPQFVLNVYSLKIWYL